MSAMNDPLAQRIERLLLRYEESRRTAILLERQVRALMDERNHLQSKLEAASLRIDTILQRLPASPTPELDEAA